MIRNFISQVTMLFSDLGNTQTIWASMRDNLPSVFANNNGTDQLVHPHSLISAFVIHLLESIISRLATSEILIL